MQRQYHHLCPATGCTLRSQRSPHHFLLGDWHPVTTYHGKGGELTPGVHIQSQYQPLRTAIRSTLPSGNIAVWILCQVFMLSSHGFLYIPVIFQLANCYIDHWSVTTWSPVINQIPGTGSFQHFLFWRLIKTCSTTVGTMSQAIDG